VLAELHIKTNDSERGDIILMNPLCSALHNPDCIGEPWCKNYCKNLNLGRNSKQLKISTKTKQNKTNKGPWLVVVNVDPSYLLGVCAAAKMSKTGKGSKLPIPT